VDGRFQKSSSDKIPTTADAGPATAPPHGDKMDKDTWYGEVLELRKKAGEYKVSLQFLKHSNTFGNLDIQPLDRIRFKCEPDGRIKKK
jgi:hypothetical protein